MRAVIYARYSSDLQSETSIDDQVRLCRERAERDGMAVTEVYSDYAISGGTLSNRPGMLALMDAAKQGEFDVVIAEALDRISRDQEDIAAIYKRLSHAEIKIVTLSEGEINELHVGLKGTMNALFLKDLAIKTRRGQRGRVAESGIADAHPGRAGQHVFHHVFRLGDAADADDGHGNCFCDLIHHPHDDRLEGGRYQPA